MSKNNGKAIKSVNLVKEVIDNLVLGADVMTTAFQETVKLEGLKYNSIHDCGDLFFALCELPIKNLKSMPIKGNLRIPTETPQVVSMINTLLTNSFIFGAGNNGITVVADEVNEGTDGVTLHFDEKYNMTGVLNGGHTSTCIVSANEVLEQKGLSPLEGVVQIKLIWTKKRVLDMDSLERLNVSELLANIAQYSNNSSSQVPYAANERMGLHQELKDMLKNTKYSNMIEWIPNEKKKGKNRVECDPIWLLTFLSAIDGITFDTDKHGKLSHPLSGDKGGRKFYDNYIIELKKYKKKEVSVEPAILRLGGIVEKYFDIIDITFREFQSWGMYSQRLKAYKELDKRDIEEVIRLSSAKSAKKENAKKKNVKEKCSPISNKPLVYVPQLSVFLPFFSSLRANIAYLPEEQGGYARFIIEDCEDLLKSTFAKLFEILVKHTNTLKGNNMAVSAKTYYCRSAFKVMWDEMYDVVYNEVVMRDTDGRREKIEKGLVN